MLISTSEKTWKVSARNLRDDVAVGQQGREQRPNVRRAPREPRSAAKEEYHELRAQDWKSVTARVTNLPPRPCARLVGDVGGRVPDRGIDERLDLAEPDQRDVGAQQPV